MAGIYSRRECVVHDVAMCLRLSHMHRETGIHYNCAYGKRGKRRAIGNGSDPAKRNRLSQGTAGSSVTCDA